MVSIVYKNFKLMYIFLLMYLLYSNKCKYNFDNNNYVCVNCKINS